MIWYPIVAFIYLFGFVYSMHHPSELLTLSFLPHQTHFESNMKIIYYLLLDIIFPVANRPVTVVQQVSSSC